MSKYPRLENKRIVLKLDPISYPQKSESIYSINYSNILKSLHKPYRQWSSVKVLG